MRSVRTAFFWLLFALGALVIGQTPPQALVNGSRAESANSTVAGDVTDLPPFVGTYSETWEEFGEMGIPNGTSILGGIATISGTDMTTSETFQMCSVFAKPSDGHILLFSDRPAGPLTISFSQPVSAFGAYWGSGYHCPQCCGYGDAASILTFQDVNGNVIGTDRFFYQGNGTLMWHGYQFGTPVKTIVRTASDGEEGVAVDGLQAIPAEPAPAIFSDFNGDGHPDYLLFNQSTRQTAVWYLNNTAHIGGAFGPTLPVGWTVVGAAGFNGDGHPDYLLFNQSTLQTAVWYLNNTAHIGGAFGPTLPVGWTLVGAADFNGDGHPDYLLFKPSTLQTAVWYLNNTTHIGGAFGPTLPPNYSLAFP